MLTPRYEIVNGPGHSGRHLWAVSIWRLWISCSTPGQVSSWAVFSPRRQQVGCWSFGLGKRNYHIGVCRSAHRRRA